MSIGSWYTSRGRIDRSTYWLKYFLPMLAIGLVFSIVLIASTVGSIDPSGQPDFPVLPFVLFFVVYLAILPPAISSQVTRLHDTGRPAWWLLLNLVPGGGIVVLVFHCMEGQPHPNQWGPPPGGQQYGQPHPQQGYGYQQPYPQQGYGQQPPYGQQ